MNENDVADLKWVFNAENKASVRSGDAMCSIYVCSSAVERRADEVPRLRQARSSESLPQRGDFQQVSDTRELSTVDTPPFAGTERKPN